MPIEREFSTIPAKPDEWPIQWRADTRRVFAGHSGAQPPGAARGQRPGDREPRRTGMVGRA